MTSPWCPSATTNSLWPLEHVEKLPHRAVGDCMKPDRDSVPVRLLDPFELALGDGHLAVGAWIVGVGFDHQSRLAHRRAIGPVFETDIDERRVELSVTRENRLRFLLRRSLGRIVIQCDGGVHAHVELALGFQPPIGLQAIGANKHVDN